MNERLRTLRSALELNQEDFGNKLNLSRSHVASLEKGVRNLTERTLSDLSREFNVNENWLRTGEGEMFIEKDSTIVSKLSTEYNLDSIDVEIIKGYLELDIEQRKAIKNYVRSVANAIPHEEIAVAKDKEDDIERELEDYRLELEAEKRGQTSSVSENTETNLG